jgi:hypothetical protein
MGAGWLRDLLIGLAFGAFGWFVTSGLWPDPELKVLSFNVADQQLNEWFLARGPLIWAENFPLVTAGMNSPDGINLLTNTSIMLPAVLLAPVTMLFGASTSFAVLSGVNLAATAFGWYLLFVRGLRMHWLAGVTAGLFCGFAPGIIAQANGHVNLTAHWLVPPIVYCVIRLVRGQTPARSGAVLGLLIVAQVFVGEEVLFLTALTLVLLTVVYPLFGWRLARSAALPVITGLAVALAVSVLLLAYPLRVQFTGPQHISGAPYSSNYYFADLASYPALSQLSIAGRDSPSFRLINSGVPEMNTFLGWPLLIVLAGCIVYLWRHQFVRAAVTVGLILAALSLGPEITINGEKTGYQGIYTWIEHVPIVESALPTRYALAIIPLIGAVFALALDQALHTSGFFRELVPVAVFAALLPLIPIPLSTNDRPPVPRFYADGYWRECVNPGGVLVPVPIPNSSDTESLHWVAAAGARFGIPEGYFLGPYGGPGNKPSLGTLSRPTSVLLDNVHRTGRVPTIGEAERQQAQTDVAYWRASCVALGPSTHRNELKRTLDRLYGKGDQIADVWVWRV